MLRVSRMILSTSENSPLWVHVTSSLACSAETYAGEPCGQGINSAAHVRLQPLGRQLLHVAAQRRLRQRTALHLMGQNSHRRR